MEARMRIHRGQNGFSMIEVVLSLGLASLVLVGTAEMLVRAVQMTGTAADRLRLTEAACSLAERLKARDLESQDLLAGHHEAMIEGGPKGDIALAWEVEDDGMGMRRIVCVATGRGRSAPSPRILVLVSTRLGF
jgi:type II secretory pathway component PulJ